MKTVLIDVMMVLEFMEEKDDPAQVLMMLQKSLEKLAPEFHAIFRATPDWCPFAAKLNQGKIMISRVD